MPKWHNTLTQSKVLQVEEGGRPDLSPLELHVFIYLTVVTSNMFYLSGDSISSVTCFITNTHRALVLCQELS